MLLKEETWTCPNMHETCCCHQIQDELTILEKVKRLSSFDDFYVLL